VTRRARRGPRWLAAAMDGLFGLPLEVKSRYRTPPEINWG
jgi:hypothetical protein